MQIDVHSHFLPPKVLEYFQEHKDIFQIEVIQTPDKKLLKLPGGGFHPLSDGFTNYEKRLADMEKSGTTKSVLSAAPVLFFYELDAKYAYDVAVICNDYAADLAKRYPDKFDAMATVPLQDMDLALLELERVRSQYGIHAVETGCILPGYMPDSEYMYPFYEYCEKNNILIFIHPTFTGREPPYDKYYNMNLIGYVQETNWALNRMIFGGVFEKFPGLRILACHGGGLFPYQFGRLIHGWQVRPEAKESCPKSPENYLKNIYFDTITHWPAALQFLAEQFGSEQIMLGTDYPYDMADAAPDETLKALRMDAGGKDKIAFGNYLYQNR